MVTEIRQVELALSRNGQKKPTKREISERIWARRGIYPTRNIDKGEIIKEEDLIASRPAITNSLAADQVNQIIGKKVKIRLKKGLPVSKNALFN